MNIKLSMQMKLNGVTFQDMIIYHLSLDQVSTVVRLRFHDHVYIKQIKTHTKRMTTSIFAGRAAHDCKSARFNVRRAVFELCSRTHFVQFPSSNIRQHIEKIKIHVAETQSYKLQERRV